MSEQLPSNIYRLPSGELKYKTDFMHLFGLSEILDLDTYRSYPDLMYHMFLFGEIKIPYVRITTFRKEKGDDYVHLPIATFNNGNGVSLEIKKTDIINYDMTKICNQYLKNWGKYKNRKGIIDDIGKLKFLNDYLTQKIKTNATSKR